MCAGRLVILADPYGKNIKKKEAKRKRVEGTKGIRTESCRAEKKTNQRIFF